MITLLHVDGRDCPVVVCDWCGERIEKGSDGNCEWLADAEGQPLLGVAVDCRGRPIAGPLFFAHKHCSRPCEKRNGHSLFQGLDVFLFHLERNCSFDRRSTKRIADLLMRL